MVQNKMHLAIHGQTAVEVLVDSVDAEYPNIGLTTLKEALRGKI